MSTPEEPKSFSKNIDKMSWQLPPGYELSVVEYSQEEYKRFADTGVTPPDLFLLSIPLPKDDLGYANLPIDQSVIYLDNFLHVSQFESQKESHYQYLLTKMTEDEAFSYFEGYSNPLDALDLTCKRPLVFNTMEELFNHEVKMRMAKTGDSRESVIRYFEEISRHITINKAHMRPLTENEGAAKDRATYELLMPKTKKGYDKLDYFVQVIFIEDKFYFLEDNTLVEEADRRYILTLADENEVRQYLNLRSYKHIDRMIQLIQERPHQFSTPEEIREYAIEMWIAAHGHTRELAEKLAHGKIRG
jgi:hypothetical protein